MKSFGAIKAWRYWSAIDPSLHHAMYQFTDKAALERAVEGPEMKRRVADFNRDWSDVTRTRDVLVLAEELFVPRLCLEDAGRRVVPHTRARCRNTAAAINVPP